MPERVYGWELGEGKRKPSPWPALQAMKELDVPPEETLMLDDLKPGVEMAIAAVRSLVHPFPAPAASGLTCSLGPKSMRLRCSFANGGAGSNCCWSWVGTFYPEYSGIHALALRGVLHQRGRVCNFPARRQGRATASFGQRGQ